MNQGREVLAQGFFITICNASTEDIKRLLCIQPVKQARVMFVTTTPIKRRRDGEEAENGPLELMRFGRYSMWLCFVEMRSPIFAVDFLSHVRAFKDKRTGMILGIGEFECFKTADDLITAAVNTIAPRFRDVTVAFDELGIITLTQDEFGLFHHTEQHMREPHPEKFEKPARHDAAKDRPRDPLPSYLDTLLKDRNAGKK